MGYKSCILCFPDMSGSPAVVMRLVASAYTVAEKAGDIVRKVLKTGDLGIVEKVGQNSHVQQWYCTFVPDIFNSVQMMPAVVI